MKTIAKSGRKRRFQVFNIGVKVLKCLTLVSMSIASHLKRVTASGRVCIYLCQSVDAGPTVACMSPHLVISSGFKWPIECVY